MSASTLASSMGALSLGGPSGSSGVQETQHTKVSKSKARRERKAKLEAASATTVERTINPDVTAGPDRPELAQPTTTSAEAGPSSLAEPRTTKKKTRRSGVRVRRRLENGRRRDEAAVRDELCLAWEGDDSFLDEDGEGHSLGSIAGVYTPIKLAAGLRRAAPASTPRTGRRQPTESSCNLSDGDDADADEVDRLPALDSDAEEGPSAMSSSEAKSSIDQFLKDPRHFTAFRANKLRLWQALCIELGLVEPAFNPESRGDVTAPESPRRSTSPPALSDAGSTTPSTTRSSRLATPCTPSAPLLPSAGAGAADPAPPRLAPMPTSLSQASALLKERAHVNLADYFAARESGPPGETGTYAHLVHASAADVRKYTKKGAKFVDLDAVKGEWLQPLLKDFGFKKGKRTA